MGVAASGGDFPACDPTPHFESFPEFADEAASDLPPELDWAALPRWMRAVPEQGPPDEVESQAGSGPDE